jgi:hypothetical protein
VDPLAHGPGSFREVAEAGQRCTARLVIKVRDEIDPQLRTATLGDNRHAPARTIRARVRRRVVLRRRALERAKMR